MTQEQFRFAVIQKWKAEWEALHPTLKWQTDNENFTPLAGVPWHRIVVRHQSPEQVSLGPVGFRRFDNTAIISVTHFVPVNTGTKLADQFCDEVKTIFNSTSFATITPISAPKSAEGTSDGLWWRVEQNFSVFYSNLA